MIVKAEGGLRGKRVVVTGAAGFIGSHLVKALLDARAEVVALVDRESSLFRMEPQLGNNRLSVVRFSSTDMDTLINERQKWGDIDSVAHLGLRVPDSSDFCEQAIADINLNLLPTLNLLKILGHVRGICLASSMAVYGRPSHLPVRDDDVPAPISSYGATKLAIENYLRVYSEISRMPVTILRYSIVYGPGELGHRAIPNFLRALSKGQAPIVYGDGSEIRDYVYIDDVVQATVRALIRKPDRVLNIGSGQGYSSLQIAQTVARLCSVDMVPQYRPREGQKINLTCDISLAKEILDYIPKTSLEQGLYKEVEWYRKEGLSLDRGEERRNIVRKETVKI